MDNPYRSCKLTRQRDGQDSRDSIRPFTVYRLQITACDPHSAGTATWIVARRFSEFVALRTALRALPGRARVQVRSVACFGLPAASSARCIVSLATTTVTGCALTKTLYKNQKQNKN